MNKHTAVDNEGKIHTRNSENRTYTHVILVKNPRRAEGGDTSWGALTWCGRPDLAQKEYAKARKDSHWAEVMIAEVALTVTGKKAVQA